MDEIPFELMQRLEKLEKFKDSVFAYLPMGSYKNCQEQIQRISKEVAYDVCMNEANKYTDDAIR